MSRPEIIKLLKQNNTKLNQSEIESIIDIFTECIHEALSKKQSVEIRGFGTFSTKLRNARIGRNPKTGEPVAIPQKKMTFFKMGKSMKERINS